MTAPLRRKARLNSMELNIDCNVMRDQCDTPRNKGNHFQCSKKRQAASIARRLLACERNAVRQPEVGASYVSS